MNTLVYHTGGLGDFVTILPAIALWRARHPDAALTFLGRPAHGRLGIAAGYFDQTVDVGESRFLSLFSTPSCDAAHPPLSAECAALLASHDSSIVFAGDDSPIVDRCRRSHRMALHQPPFPSNHYHVVDYHLSIFPSWERDRVGRIPRIRVAAKRLHGDETGVPTVAIQPGSGSARKNWPIERFTELTFGLKALGAKILWILGPVESGLAVPENAEAIRDIELPRLCAILASVALYVGNDSGVSHLAAACGAPSLVLFGASDPSVWRPLGNRTRVISGIVPCGPCHGNTTPDAACRGECMQGISVGTVLRECRTILAGT